VKRQWEPRGALFVEGFVSTEMMHWSYRPRSLGRHNTRKKIAHELQHRGEQTSTWAIYGREDHGEGKWRRAQ